MPKRPPRGKLGAISRSATLPNAKTPRQPLRPVGRFCVCACCDPCRHYMLALFDASIFLLLSRCIAWRRRMIPDDESRKCRAGGGWRARAGSADQDERWKSLRKGCSGALAQGHSLSHAHRHPDDRRPRNSSVPCLTTRRAFCLSASLNRRRDVRTAVHFAGSDGRWWSPDLPGPKTYNLSFPKT